MFLAQKSSFKIKNLQWIIISLLMWLLISVPIYFINKSFFRDVTPYYLINSYLDYSFGFIKRGLFAEIISFIPISHVTSLFIMTYLIGFALIAIITYQFKEKLNSKNDFLIFVLIILNPLFVKNFIFHVGSIDILFVLYLLIVGFSNYRISKFFMLVYPVMVFIHEAVSIMFLPAIIYIYAVRFKNIECTKKITFLSIVLSILISLFIFKYNGFNAKFADVYNHLLIKKVNTIINISDNNLKFLLNLYFYSIQEHINMAWSYERMLKLSKVLYIFIITYFINEYLIDTVFKIIREHSKIPYIVCLLSSGFFLLILLAVDISRFIGIMFSILLICAITTNKELFFETLKYKFQTKNLFTGGLIIINTIIHPMFGLIMPFSYL